MISHMDSVRCGSYVVFVLISSKIMHLPDLIKHCYSPRYCMSALLAISCCVVPRGVVISAETDYIISWKGNHRPCGAVCAETNP